MDKNIAEQIKDKNVDIELFAEEIIEDEKLREDVIEQLMTNKQIMMYYHCYSIVSRASESEPELFYKYWDAFVSLLSHENSYHRDIGITLITNLISIDEERRFDTILDQYLGILHDEKFMTAQCLAQNLPKVVEHRKDLRKKIIDTFLEIDDKLKYPVKQSALLKCDFLKVLEVIYDDNEYREVITEYIKDARKSISPKTKRKAKELMIKYSE